MMAMHWATRYSDDKTMRVLLDYKADSESRTASYYTPLHVAVSWRDTNPFGVENRCVQFFEVSELQYLRNYVL